MTAAPFGAARYAGSRVQRVEDARLLTGAGTFVDDVTRPGMLHACFVRSPHPRARIVSIDTSAALALPGVHAVFTADDLNGDVVEAWYTGTGNMVPDTPRPPLAQRRGPVRRRHRRPRRGGQPLPRGGRRRAGRRGLRAAARGRRLRVREDGGSARARGLPGQPRGRARRRARRDDRRRLRRRRARGQRDDLGAGAGRRPDGDPRPGRGVVAGQRRADRLGGHAGTARGADVRRPAARHPRAQRPGDHPRRRRRLRAEGRAAARGHLRAAGGAQAGRRGQVDRGPPGEPAVRRHGPARARRRRGSPSTRRGRSSPRRSTTSRTSARTRRRGRSSPARRPG